MHQVLKLLWVRYSWCILFLKWQICIFLYSVSDSSGQLSGIMFWYGISPHENIIYSGTLLLFHSRLTHLTEVSTFSMVMRVISLTSNCSKPVLLLKGTPYLCPKGLTWWHHWCADGKSGQIKGCVGHIITMQNSEVSIPTPHISASFIQANKEALSLGSIPAQKTFEGKEASSVARRRVPRDG